MSLRQPHHTKLPAASRWIAAFCALTIWLLGLFASSAELHGALHRDAGQADHSCAVTLFREGFENTLGFATIVVTPALFPAGEMVAVAAVPVADGEVRLPPVCGPPLC